MKADQPYKLIAWDEDGKLTSELIIQNGLRSGVVLDWYESGEKKSEAIYQNDELIDKTIWDQQGKVLEEF